MCFNDTGRGRFVVLSEIPSIMNEGALVLLCNNKFNHGSLKSTSTVILLRGIRYCPCTLLKHKVNQSHTKITRNKTKYCKERKFSNRLIVAMIT